MEIAMNIRVIGLTTGFANLTPPFQFISKLKIKTFGLVSRIRDVEVGGLKIHNFLP
jgi:hypothetical protein